MPRSRQSMWIRVFAVTALLVATALPLGGCALREVVAQTERVDAAGTLRGKVVAQQVPQRDVVVAVLRKSEAAQLSLYRMTPPAADGSFSVYVPAGEFYVGAFIDANHNGQFEPGEPGKLYGKPSLVAVRAKETVDVELTLSPTSTPSGLDLPANSPQRPEVGGNVGVVTTLDDARFEPANGLLGMWRPFDFIAGPHGGVFMLGEYDPDRIPVVFVHGIGGTPRDFAGTLAGLDTKRYQPWVLYYPSGLPLDMVSNGFASALQQLQLRYGFQRCAVVAHSMGGLVARSFMQKAWERYPEQAQTLRVLITVNSPLGGMNSAALAVDKSPVVVPSWNDVATGSAFLRGLEQAKWHSDVPYYLVFSYEGDKNGDGTVPLQSQLPQAFQSQATRLFGFPGTHVGTLSNPAFIAQLNQLLDSTLTAASAMPPSAAAAGKAAR